MQVLVQDWNGFVDGIFRSQLLQVKPVNHVPWRHPWFTTVKWDPERETYVARVKPGFCVSETTAQVTARGDDGGEVSLSDDPVLPVSVAAWRALGTDAVSVDGGGDPVPDSFLARGVLDPVNISTSGPGGLVQSINGFSSTREEARLLRACEVLLHHDRLVSAESVATVAGQGGTEAEFGVDVSAPPGQRPEAYLRIVRSYRPEPERTPLERLQGIPDKGFDTIHLATLYLLSPPGQAEGSKPERAGWTGFVAHPVFWNLQYRQKYLAPLVEPTVLRLPAPGLGAGALGAVGGPMLDLINDNNAALDAFFNQAGSSGRFFTV